MYTNLIFYIVVLFNYIALDEYSEAPVKIEQWQQSKEVEIENLKLRIAQLQELLKDYNPHLTQKIQIR